MHRVLIRVAPYLFRDILDRTSLDPDSPEFIAYVGGYLSRIYDGRLTHIAVDYFPDDEADDDDDGYAIICVSSFASHRAASDFARLHRGTLIG